MSHTDVLRKIIFHRFNRYPRLQGPKGFTLVEVLVTFLIGGTVVSGLLFLTNELLTADQQESSRTETQRDLQSGLDYISAELRQAVFVYPDANCLEVGTGAVCGEFIDHTKVKTLSEYPDATSIPVLAFWKQTELSENLIEDCATSVEDPEGVTCLNGNGYSLVVYAYSENKNDNGPWDGEAGILRYEMQLTKESVEGSDTATFGQYVSPIKSGTGGIINFRSWPDPDPGARNQQAIFAEPEILVDFVDDFSNSSITRVCPEANPALALPSYQASPTGISDRTFPDDLGGFYACVNSSSSLTGDENTRRGDDEENNPIYGYGNQDVIVYIKGNAVGRSGLLTETSSTPTLETRTLVRGALNR